MLTVPAVMRLMEAQVEQAGLAACPLDGKIFAKLNRADDTVFWIVGGHRTARHVVERLLCERNQH
ncbi:hypothetical protein [Paraburkholderia caffeinilytica]|uniref:hypothetical protein n=1 Tax=Paraburkholderia caffeinilytica TaxID=1761016 RepID=UPI0038B79DB3